MDLEIRVGDEVRTARVRSPAVIGAHEHSDVSLAGVEGVNRRHALLARGLGGWTVFDLDSTNGVKVNGERAPRADLLPGDELRIGRARLTLVADGGAADARQRLDEMAAELLADSDAGAALADRCRLRVECRGEWVLDATVDRDRTLGYSARCGLRLPRAGVSSLHALFARDAGGWQLHDLRSDTGILYLGKRVASVALTTGDIVKLGEARVHVELLLDPAIAASAPVSDLPLDAPPDSAPELALLSGADTPTSSFEFQLDETPPAAIDRMRFGDEALAAGKPNLAVEHFAAGCELAPWSLALRRRLRAAQGKHAGRPATQPSGVWWPLVRAQVRARSALRRGRLENCLRHSETGLALDPWNRGLLLLQAAAYEQHGMLDGTLWCLQVGLRRAPDDPCFNRPLGRLYGVLGAQARAIKHLERVAAALPDSREARDEYQRAIVEKTIGANKK